MCTNVSRREEVEALTQTEIRMRYKRFSVDIEIHIYVYIYTHMHKYKLRSIKFSGGPAKKRIPFRGRAIALRSLSVQELCPGFLQPS